MGYGTRNGPHRRVLAGRDGPGRRLIDVAVRSPGLWHRGRVRVDQLSTLSRQSGLQNEDHKADVNGVLRLSRFGRVCGGSPRMSTLRW
jgi:hypothetical protein